MLVGPGTQQSNVALGVRGVPLQHGTQLGFAPGAHEAPAFVGSQHPAPPLGPPAPANVVTPEGVYAQPQFFAPLIPQQPWGDGAPPEPMVEQLLVPPPSAAGHGCRPDSQKLVALQVLHDPVDP